MRLLLVLSLLLLSQAPLAQKVVPQASNSPAGLANCALGTAEAFLNAGAVRAALYNNGALFNRGTDPTYEVPAGSGINAMFSTTLMVGGLADDTLRFAGSTYGPYEFWPGPLDADGETTAETCAAFDRIWTVTIDDLETYDRTGTATADLEDWPIAVGAPFYIDTNGNGRQDEGVVDASESTISLDPGDAGYGTRRLNLKAGERPVILGVQTAWWVMNDAGGEHEWSEAPALGIEVRAMAWTTGGGSLDELGRSTFYRHEIINRSGRALEDVRAGLYLDPDLGGPLDDRVGSDSTRQMVIVYNGADVDEGTWGYGDRPPALGVDLLSGASSVLHPFKGTPSGAGEPNEAPGAYNYLGGLWEDGSPLLTGEFGYDGDINFRGEIEEYEFGPATRWSFSGDGAAGEFWSQENIDGQGTPLIPSDKKAVIAAPAVDLEAGERTVLDAAVLFARGADRLDSIVRLLEVSDAAQAYYEDGGLAVSDEAVPSRPGLALETYPNPASSRVEVAFALPVAGPVRLAVYDVLGRQVAVLEDGLVAAGEHRRALEVERLAPGVYVVVLEGAEARASRTVTVVR
ncbi:T9SS type A sorting domain-containing protein [Rubrivirga sp.]|uniref:T9SS type A sorting domain-containing protein n=1 Tax=Rubrivirga sp. TaxID=1885344 RepID=UPI003C70888E